MGECCKNESFVECCEGGTERFVDCFECVGEARLGEWCEGERDGLRECCEGGTTGECFTPLARGRFMSTKAEIVRSTRLRLLLLVFNLFRISVTFS